MGVEPSGRARLIHRLSRGRGLASTAKGQSQRWAGTPRVAPPPLAQRAAPLGALPSVRPCCRRPAADAGVLPSVAAAPAAGILFEVPGWSLTVPQAFVFSAASKHACTSEAEPRCNAWALPPSSRRPAPARLHLTPRNSRRPPRRAPLCLRPAARYSLLYFLWHARRRGPAIRSRRAGQPVRAARLCCRSTRRRPRSGHACPPTRCPHCRAPHAVGACPPTSEPVAVAASPPNPPQPTKWKRRR